MFILLDVERNELVMRVYTTRNHLVTKFVEEAKYCQNKPNIVEAPWLISALESLGDFEMVSAREAK